jgi:predicted nucleotidyltransferase component of viral defense system
MLTDVELAREAAATGFRAEVLEKVIRLVELLETMRSHPFLKGRVALKGGAALNLFVLDVPRLSVDVDLNYIGSVDRATMLTERPKVEQAVQAVCGRLGVQVKRVPSDHAGGKWRLSYPGASGGSGTLELDLDFMQRTPLWPHAVLDSRSIGSFAARQVPVLDIHEIAAGKLRALLSRNASRDLFDAWEMLRRGGLDVSRLRLGFVVYGGASRKDWRMVSVVDVKGDPADVQSSLMPMMRSSLAPPPAELTIWTEKLVKECRDLLAAVLPLEPQEQEFLRLLNDEGRIVPNLLTEDEDMQGLIIRHPGLRWKALNVRKHLGLSVDDHEET